MITTRTTPPSSYIDVISITEVERQCKVDPDYDTEILTVMLGAACRWVEETYGVALKATTCKMVGEEFPCYAEPLTVGPVTSISSVTYLDTDDAEQTLATSKYSKDLISNPARILFSAIPSVSSQLNAVVIEYVAGFTTVPLPVKQAVLMMTSTLYENRSNEITGTIVSKVQFATDALMQPFRNYV